MAKSADLSSEGFPSESVGGDGISITDFREYLQKINIRVGARDQRLLFSYMKKTAFKEQVLSDEEVFPILKNFLLHRADKNNIEMIRQECRKTCNFWTLDKLCGIEIVGDELPADSAVKQELDRLARCAARLPTDVNEKDTRKRDWMFQRYDIGKTGRLVMAAVDNMIHILFGEIAYDVKDVVRAAFRATKNVSVDSGAADPSSANQIEREEFRLLLLALKSHIELFIAFRMVDSSRDMKIDFDEFLKSLPMLKRWGVDTSDPQALFEMIDADHSGEITFNEFVNWALKEAIIADLEYRERISHNVGVGDTVLLTGEYRGIVAKVISYDRTTKTYVLELPDGTRINKKNTEFVNGAATQEVLPPVPTGTYGHSKWFESLLRNDNIMPGTDHPWITEEPIYIKSEWSNRRGEYHFEIRCNFAGDAMKTSSWAKSFKEAKNFAAKSMKEKIEGHPRVLEALQYVNQEVAKEKEAEDKRMAELKEELGVMNDAHLTYKMQLWKRDMIGVTKIKADGFFRVLKDCKAKVSQREANLIHRNCSKGSAEASFQDLNHFFKEAKHLDRKLDSVRQSVLKSWKLAKWEGFVSRSIPEDKDANIEAWDAEHQKPDDNDIAKDLEYNEFHAAAAGDQKVEEEEEVQAAERNNAEHENLMHEQKVMLSHLESFLDDTKDAPVRKKSAPKPQVKVKGKKKGGLVVKGTARKAMSTDVKDTKKNIVRSRPKAGKARA